MAFSTSGTCIRTPQLRMPASNKASAKRRVRSSWRTGMDRPCRAMLAWAAATRSGEKSAAVDIEAAPGETHRVSDPTADIEPLPPRHELAIR